MKRKGKDEVKERHITEIRLLKESRGVGRLRQMDGCLVWSS